MPWNGIAESKFRTPRRTITYSYDRLYRLTQASYSTGESFAYTYDAVGNRVSATDSSSTRSYVYDQANRLTSEVVGRVTTTYTWDANGNLLSDGASSYTYDTANRLISIVNGGVTTVRSALC